MRVYYTEAPAALGFLRVHQIGCAGLVPWAAVVSKSLHQLHNLGKGSPREESGLASLAAGPP